MAKYSILIKPSAAGELEAVEPKKARQWIAKRIAGLAADPRLFGVQKLSGREYYRIRQGDYRLVYSIDDGQRILIVVKIGHRREVYREG